MDEIFINYYYVGRIIQYYEDYKDFFFAEDMQSFLIPKVNGLEIAKVKQMANRLLKKNGVKIVISSLPKKNGWRAIYKILE